MVLHHLGESTLSDIKDVEKECVAAGAKTIVVAGDISNPATAQDVSVFSPTSPTQTMLLIRSFAFSVLALPEVR